MPTPDRDLISIEANVLQDDSPSSKDYADNGELWEQGDVRDGAVAGKAVSVLLGENGRRHGASAAGKRLSLTGTIVSSGTAVTGSGTAFLSELQVSDWIQPDARTGEWREVASIADDENLVVTASFKTNITLPAAFSRIRFIAEQLDELETIITDGVGYINSGTTDFPTGTAIKHKVLEIGSWDMDATTSLDIAHGLTFTNILNVTGYFTNDAQTVLHQFNSYSSLVAAFQLDAYIENINSTNIRLQRKSGGIFDNTNYNDTGINRGYLLVTHI